MSAMLNGHSGEDYPVVVDDIDSPAIGQPALTTAEKGA
jgi:hypothetical protein